MKETGYRLNVGLIVANQEGKLLLLQKEKYKELAISSRWYKR